MQNSSAWIIGALLLASLANDASEFNSLACSGFTVKTLFDLDKHSQLGSFCRFIRGGVRLCRRPRVPTVTTIAGGSSRKPGFADGPGDTARFSSEFSLACSCGSLLIADRGNRLIREIQIDDPKSRDSSDSAVSGPQKWALIPVVLLGICLEMPLGAFIIWKILDQRCRQAGDQLGNTERLLAGVPEDDDLQVRQQKRTC
ncbi:hypothetical protein SELMODRAFT_409048 [Selaginella moellendorffii]|uniref:Uncharacterized protein n=1 Tax=Selaginella moellendorffii TaxID=88036 RepID=D8R998_SELML|nr:hypothetical protein SELMODRAFT_409048 [Selaginella moellendorffii]